MAQTAGGTYYAASSELVSSWPATSLDLANQLESRFAAKYSTPGAWTAWTPTYTQTGALTTSTNVARYMTVGKLVEAWVTTTFSNAGTTNSLLKLTNLPVAAYSTSAEIRIIGTGTFYDASAATTYHGSFLWVTASDIRFLGDWSQSEAWGIYPTLAVANGDVFRYHLTYESV